MGERAEDESWPSRTWGLALLGALVAFAIRLLVGEGVAAPGMLALATFLGVGGVVFAFTLERWRGAWAVIFALVAGLVVASVIFWNGGPGAWNASDGWRVACAALAVAIAAPLFQVAQREGRWALPYPAVHNQAWANGILWFAGWLFVGLVWLLVLLLGALFDLIGIDLVRKALRAASVASVLTGAAFGAAIGLLRERGRILALLQRVTMTVLGVLAPVLGAGLFLFLLSLPFTGLAPLWGATKATTPILLACVVGALLLANAVIGDSAKDEARHPLLRGGAAVLGGVMLPLAAIAAVSVWLRVAQYGLTPSRIWALLFVGIACAYGLAYWAALARRQQAWPGAARRANLMLAVGLCALALLLSTPFVNFGALSARDQAARLESGRIAPEKFDWVALAFDFGPAGRRALARLESGGRTAAIRAQATHALAAKNRWELAAAQRQAQTKADFTGRVTILPRRVALPRGLADAVARVGGCAARPSPCLLYYVAGSDTAVQVRAPAGCADCPPITTLLVRRRDGWKAGAEADPPEPRDAARARRLREAMAKGEVEVRTVARRQLFIGGEPVGGVFR